MRATVTWPCSVSVMVRRTVFDAQSASFLLIESGHRMSAPIASQRLPFASVVKSGYSVMNVESTFSPFAGSSIAVRIAG